MSWLWGVPVFIVVLEVAAFILLIWIGVRYFDRRYKGRRSNQSMDLYTGSLEKTAEVFIDPKDGLKYRVYYNRQTGERVYIRED